MAPHTAESSRTERVGASMQRAPESPRTYLRRVTRDWHEAVEASYERFDLQSYEGLSGFLLRQAGALLPLEQQITACGADTMMPDWPERRRSDALLADLARLGLAPPAVEPCGPLPSRLHGLGALYVLEGSKLGGRVLMRRVLASADPRVRATTRFLGHGDPAGWSGFLAVLNRVAPTPQTLAQLRAGASMAFARFLPTATSGGGVHAVGPVRADLVRDHQA